MLLNSDTRNADEGEGEGTQIRSLIPSCAVEFVGPGRVRVVEEAASPPGPRQLLLRSECSLVSTGTEVPPTASHIVSPCFCSRCMEMLRRCATARVCVCMSGEGVQGGHGPHAGSGSHYRIHEGGRHDVSSEIWVTTRFAHIPCRHIRSMRLY